jgi:PAS domain S-box-containing protein
VLIVDDNPELVGALKGVLESVTTQGAPRYEVRTASCGKDALRVAEDEGFDVAIVDVKLPDVSGVDLIVPLRASPRPREVVLITGYASVDAAIGALRSGAFAFVSKSFRPEELISTVDQALTKVHLTRGREMLERRYRSVVELTDVLVVALDADQRLQLFNRKAANLAGVDPDDALGRDFLASWIPSEERPRMREAILQAETSDRTREVEADFVEGSPEHPLARRRVRWHLSRAQEEQGPPIM